MESRLVLPSLEEVQAARRTLKKTLKEFSGWVQGSWPKTLRASNLELRAEKIRKNIGNIQEGIEEARRYFRKKITKYRKQILGGCEVRDIGKFDRKLEKAEKKVFRLAEEKKKLRKLRKKFEEILERLDRASDVFSNLSSEKFMSILERVLIQEIGRLKVTREKKEEEPSLDEAEKCNEVGCTDAIIKGGSAFVNTVQKSNLLERSDSALQSFTTLGFGDFPALRQ
jgi:hypothetical protein